MGFEKEDIYCAGVENALRPNFDKWQKPLEKKGSALDLGHSYVMS